MSHIHLVYLLIALQAADAFTTIYALERPGATESNGLMAKLFKAVGVVPGALLVKVAIVALICQTHTDVPDWLIAGLCALSALVVVNNLNAIRKQRQQKA